MESTETTPKRQKTGGEGPFKVEWEWMYFFVCRESVAKCLVCGAEVKCIRKSSIERHFNRQHKDAYENLTGEERLEKLQELKGRNLQEITISNEEVFLSFLLYNVFPSP